MRLRLLRLRWRRRLRESQRQVGGLGSQTERHIDRHFVRRLGNLEQVRRFVLTWLALLVLLIGGLLIQNIALSSHYQTLRPVPGGIYTEGELGTFTNANPMYATSDVDTSVARLIFAGLFTYNERNQLIGELAEGYSVDASGTTYTVRLKPHLTWQDGQPLTSADVVFTYQSIQNPDAQSPLQNSWRDINVSAPDARTVVFRLPSSLASFPHNMTNGIVPQHLLKDIPAVGLRSADFNTINPVGAGPFAWRDIQVTGNDPATAEEQIELVPFDNYARGKPKLQEFIVHAYPSQQKLTDAFRDGRLTGLQGLTTVPDDLKGASNLEVHSPLLTAETMVFFKMTSGVLRDQQVRQALVEGTDTASILKNLGYPTRAVNEPFLIGQLGYDSKLGQAKFNLKAAKQRLDAAGWKVAAKGARTKDGQILAFTLTAPNNAEYRSVSQQLQKQWQKLGVNLRVQLQDNTSFHDTLSQHNYDALLYGISIGPDPDVFVYWDSSQADIRSSNRLNLSEYKNAAADTAIKAGRSRSDPVLRAVKYKPFLQAWQKDAPAVGLYQPRMLYLTNGPVAGFNDRVLNSPANRFDNVQNWQIRQAKVTN